ncbi:zf-TFIIB domain-containing protein [Alistipes sp. ZOR0009]|uniref:TFIIB-type zinc ribbon-containing protein n=1 Tax=Alistipes sp. ZOR0009 TaxID=1339253 RepID=UPI0006470250|nr:zf-TFIIB domain-containing protein [Alistipes sp. ZOR0009]
MNCPLCNVPLMMADKQGVEIDYCPKCRGIWLDRGELEKIIERSLQPGFGYHDDDHYNKHHDSHKSPFSHDKYPNKHKRGFLGDLFDF